jgi:hypothetical protein
VKVAGNVPTKVEKKKRRGALKRRPYTHRNDGETVEARVLDFIEKTPGKKGAEIIRGLGEVNGRTVRTMLRRLKEAQKIEKRGNGWFKK